MGLKLEDLERTDIRKFMLEEFETDLKDGRLYLSDRLNDASKDAYVSLLREAILNGDDEFLAKGILENNCLKSVMPRRNRSGRMTMVKVPKDAHFTLAEGEFNRFYIRALCVKMISEELKIEVYRTKQVKNPRPESQYLIGKLLDPEKLLNDLRQNIGVDTALNVPAGPNLGLSVRIKK